MTQCVWRKARVAKAEKIEVAEGTEVGQRQTAGQVGLCVDGRGRGAEETGRGRKRVERRGCVEEEKKLDLGKRRLRRESDFFHTEDTDSRYS